MQIEHQAGFVELGLGEVLHYVVTGKGNDATELRTIHDWVIKPKLRTVKGTAEVNSWGGYEKQYQVRLDPGRLAKHGLTFDQVVEKGFMVGMGGTSIALLLLTQLDKVILSRALTLEMFGYYMLATSVAANLLRLVVPVQQAIFPRFSTLAV